MSCNGPQSLIPNREHHDQTSYRLRCSEKLPAFLAGRILRVRGCDCPGPGPDFFHSTITSRQEVGVLNLIRLVQDSGGRQLNRLGVRWLSCRARLQTARLYGDQYLARSHPGVSAAPRKPAIAPYEARCLCSLRRAMMSSRPGPEGSFPFSASPTLRTTWQLTADE